MNKYIFTFGSGQLYAGFYQPIYAKDSNTARRGMVKIHGVKWSHQYNQEEWERFEKDVRDRSFLEQPLEAIYYEEEVE